MRLDKIFIINIQNDQKTSLFYRHALRGRYQKQQQKVVGAYQTQYNHV